MTGYDHFRIHVGGDGTDDVALPQGRPQPTVHEAWPSVLARRQVRCSSIAGHGLGRRWLGMDSILPGGRIVGPRGTSARASPAARIQA